MLLSDAVDSNWVKQHKIGPDGFLQMAFQLAHASTHDGKAGATYESASTSAFKHGRTETIRTFIFYVFFFTIFLFVNILLYRIDFVNYCLEICFNGAFFLFLVFFVIVAFKQARINSNMLKTSVV